MVVDIGLPGMSGIELCTALRANEIDVPILILSARDEVGDRVAGFAPVPTTISSSRSRSTSSSPGCTPSYDGRRGRREPPVGDPSPDRLGRPRPAPGDRQLDPLDLSRREFDLLSTFVANPGIVLSRIRLLELVWGYDFDVDTNVVDVFVGYLRRKLAAAGLPKSSRPCAASASSCGSRDALRLPTRTGSLRSRRRS